jgi:hypothetical protein
MKGPSMRTGVKVLLGVTGAAALLVAGTCGAGILWIQSNQEDLREQGLVALKEGGRFGSGKEAPACVEEGLARLSDSSFDVLSEARNKVWVEACLKTATLPAGFCDGVPPRDEILASASWAVTRCERAGRPGSQPCARLIGAVQERCLTPR